MSSSDSALHDHWRAGSGEPLLLVHGFTATWRTWGRVPEMLASDFDVLAPTLPGHRGGPPLREGDTVEGLVDGLEAMLDELGWATPHVAGFSLGGLLALELAKRGRARTVTAMSPAGSHVTRRDRAALRRVFRRSRAGAMRIRSRADRLYASPRLRRLALRDMMYDGSRVDRAVALAMLDDFVETPCFDLVIEEVKRAPVVGDLDRIQAPVHLMWSERDRVIPVRHAAFFRQAIPHATYEVIPRAGHVPFWDAPEAVAQGIRHGAGRALAVAAPAG
jgi:pimeloyl-ACP methyl ester carboxylesterase